MSKGTDRPGLGSLGSAALTSASTFVVTVIAAIGGVVIAREFGRTEETDGFLATYGVFIVVVLAAQAIRVAVLPSLARAREERRLAGEIAGFAAAVAAIVVPMLLLAELATGPVAKVLTGNGPDVAQDAAAEALRWMVPAACAQLFAGLAASGLAALDDYATAALGYAIGSAAGLALILARVDADGIIVVAWGMTLNATIAFLVPLAGLAWRALRSRMPAAAVRATGPPLRIRLGTFASATALPIALQLLYVICLPFAGGLGTGSVTSFGYAYLGSAGLVSIAALSLGLVSSVPLTRAGLGPALATRHVVSASWIALALIGVAAGVFALAGSTVVKAVLGGAYGGGVGSELGRLVVLLSPWMVASVGVTVTFPLLFVVSRTRALPVIAGVVLILQIPLAWAASRLFELDGLALALAISTIFVLAALLHELDALASAARGIMVAAAVVGGITAAAFVPVSLVLGSLAAAVVGACLYGLVLAVARPPGLRSAWRYLRQLS